MKEFLFHKRNDAQPTPEVTETAGVNEVTEAPEIPTVPEAPEVPEVPEVPETPETPEAPEETREEVSTAYLLEQLEAVRKDSAYIQAAMDQISRMGPGEEAKVAALREIAVSRETTNQQLIGVYTTLLSRKNPPRMPNFDGWGKKWSDFGSKVKKSVELTPEQEAEVKRQLDEAAQDLQDAARDLKDAAKRGAKRSGESIQHYVNEALSAISQATNGRVDIHIGDQGVSVINRGTGSRRAAGSALDMAAEILRDHSISTEEKELILEHAEELRDLEESLQAQVLELLGDPSVSTEDKELVFDHLDELRETAEEGLRAQVLELLGDPSVSTEGKELIFEHLDELRETAEGLQAQVLELLGDPSISTEGKELIFDHIEAIRAVEEKVQVKAMEILGDVTLSAEEKELILEHLEDLQELS